MITGSRPYPEANPGAAYGGGAMPLFEKLQRATDLCSIRSYCDQTWNLSNWEVRELGIRSFERPFTCTILVFAAQLITVLIKHFGL